MSVCSFCTDSNAYGDVHNEQLVISSRQTYYRILTVGKSEYFLTLTDCVDTHIWITVAGVRESESHESTESLGSRQSSTALVTEGFKGR